jgi:iron complex transport system permease protein
VLLLSGIAISYLFQSLVSALRYTSNVRDLPELIFWTMGNLGAIPFNGILMMGIVSTIACFMMMFFAWDLNTIMQGEETSVSLGVDYKKIMIISFLISTLLTASVVSWTGVIGFVGLVAPHISRMIVGSDYRFTIPASALTGAFLLLLSDTLARTLFSPVELPVGVITSFIGVPFFIYLIVRRRT